MFYHLKNFKRPGSQCYKNFFPPLLMMRPNKLECLYLAIPFQSILTFAGSTRILPKKDAPERCSNYWVLALPSNSKTWLERVSKDKPSSLLCLVICNEEKKFYKIDTWVSILWNFFSSSLTLRWVSRGCNSSALPNICNNCQSLPLWNSLTAKLWRQAPRLITLGWNVETL
jgi:hypothetical protein